jgi:hypothetical protein
MPKPLAICIEDLEAHGEAERYLRCVAVGGRSAGLTLDDRGAVHWRSDPSGATCELWVSMDERLILFRREGGASVAVERSGRSLDVPFGKPVVLLDRDRVRVGGRHLRIHVHGPAPRVHAPSPLPVQPAASIGRTAAAIGLAAALGGGAACGKGAGAPETAGPSNPSGGSSDGWSSGRIPPEDAAVDESAEEIELRLQPPEMAAVDEPIPPPEPDDVGESSEEIDVRMNPPGPTAVDIPTPPEDPPDADAGAEDPADAVSPTAARDVPIEVRIHPPRMAPPDRDDP